MKVLVVAAHPDDEVLGCGGTIARHIANNDNVSALVMGEGRKAGQTGNVGDYQTHYEELTKVKLILGYHNLHTYTLDDQRFDTYPLLDIIKMIEQVRDEVLPDVVYTHWDGDLNKDHQVICQATLTAFRPTSCAQHIYQYPIPSSTDWGTQRFNPNHYVDISEYIGKKVEAFGYYKDAQKDNLSFLSNCGIVNWATFWGSMVHLKAAEPFILFREVVK